MDPVTPVGPVGPVTPVAPGDPWFAVPEPRYSSKIIQSEETELGSDGSVSPIIPYAIVDVPTFNW